MSWGIGSIIPADARVFVVLAVVAVVVSAIYAFLGWEWAAISLGGFALIPVALLAALNS